MSFLNRYFLVGLVGMLVPIAIHLLTRDRIRRVEFSTLRFFVKTSGRVLRRKRFQEMILLALRALACALVAVAFARPLLDREDPADKLQTVQARTARVIVVDVSASMGRSGAAQEARQAAAKALDELSENTDAAAVIAFDASPTVAAPLAKRFDEARKALGALKPAQGGTNIPSALRLADAQLKRARADRRQIVLISDLQRTGWQDLKEDFRLEAGVKLTVRPIGIEPGKGNLAIVGGSVPDMAVLDREPQAVSVQIANYSDQPADGVQVRFELGDKTETRSVNLRAAGTASATFRHVFDTPGDNRGRVRIVRDDDVPQDNVLYFNTRVIPKIKVVLIDGAMAGGQPSDAAFYLQTAMAPGPDVASPFDCRTVAATEVTGQDLATARAAILSDVAAVGSSAAKALGDLLRRRGGLLFMPGPKVDAKAFDECFADLAPCKLRQVRTARMQRTGGFGAAITHIDFQHPVFEIFSHPRHGDLSLPKFRRYWEVTDSQFAQVLAKFDDNRPAVLARQIGGGVSMLLASSADTEWTDFPKQTTFLPYIWQTLKYLAARTEHRTAYTVGDPLPLPAGGKLTGPDGKDVPKDQPAAETPGFYVLSGADGQETLTLAINRSPAESDPAAVAGDEIVEAVQRPVLVEPAGGPDDKDRKKPKRDKDERGLWWWVLLALCALLAGELLLGNKTLRH